MLFGKTSVVVAAIVATVCGCVRRVESPLTPVRPVRVYTTVPQNSLERTYAGMATADDASNLAFKIGGQIVSFPSTKGNIVAKETVIAELNPRDYLLAEQADLSAYRTAKAQLDRSRRLLERQAISRQEYEIASTEFVEAESRYLNSRDLVADTKLTAPFAGIIEQRYVDTYQRVQAGEAIVKLVNPATRSVKFTMPESGIPLLAEGKVSFLVEFDNYKGVGFAARLKEYIASSYEGTGVPVTLTLDDRRLDAGRYIISPGMSCSVFMSVRFPEGDNSVSIPLTAIYAPIGAGEYVWVVVESNGVDRVELRRVRLGELRGYDMVSVVEGLHVGERVVDAGVYRLSEGQMVEILK